MAERIKTLIVTQTIVGLAVLALAVLQAVEHEQWWAPVAVTVALLAGLPAWLLAGHRHGRWVAALDLAVWAIVVVSAGHWSSSTTAGPGVLMALPIVGLAFVLRDENAAWWMAALCTIAYLVAVLLTPGASPDFSLPSRDGLLGALLTAAGIWASAAAAWIVVRAWRREVAVEREGRAEAEAGAAEQARTTSELKQRTADQAARLECVGEWSLQAVAVHERVVVLPLGGYLDDARAAQARQALLTAIAGRRARVALIDVTNLRDVDGGGAVQLKTMVEAGRLLGADVALVGMRPSLASSLIASQVDVRLLAGYVDLQSGLEWALGQTGWRIVANG